MEVARLRALIFGLADQAEGGEHAWHFIYRGVQMACMTDSGYGRMRIVAPIIEASELRPDHMYAMLDANYHSALDARYAISDGMVMVAFIHPLAPLDEGLVESAMRQVASAVKTFGGTG